MAPRRGFLCTPRRHHLPNHARQHGSRVSQPIRSRHSHALLMKSGSGPRRQRAVVAARTTGPQGGRRWAIGNCSRSVRSAASPWRTGLKCRSQRLSVADRAARERGALSRAPRHHNRPRPCGRRGRAQGGSPGRQQGHEVAERGEDGHAGAQHRGSGRRKTYRLTHNVRSAGTPAAS